MLARKAVDHRLEEVGILPQIAQGKPFKLLWLGQLEPKISSGLSEPDVSLECFAKILAKARGISPAKL